MRQKYERLLLRIYEQDMGLIDEVNTMADLLGTTQNEYVLQAIKERLQVDLSIHRDTFLALKQIRDGKGT